jgi:capsular polysaccharide biosynthesis protein
MKTYQLLVIQVLALLFIGCGAATNNVLPTSASPTDVLNAYVEASDRKDLAAVKATLSKGTMKMYEDAAQKRQLSADEVMKEQFEATTSTGLKSKIQPGKETITGDTAIVEAKDSQTGGTEQIPLVKEDGAWKLAFDKYLENLMERMREEMKITAPPPPSNKLATNK